MSVQIVEIAGQKMAMLPMADYERLLDIAEDKADGTAAAESARRRLEGEEYLSAEMVDRILAGEAPLRVWRKCRKLSQGALGKMIGTTAATISRLESGGMQGDRRRWRAIADALGLSVDDLLPPSV